MLHIDLEVKKQICYKAPTQQRIFYPDIGSDGKNSNFPKSAQIRGAQISRYQFRWEELKFPYIVLAPG
jgi:hypothetical protein